MPNTEVSKIQIREGRALTETGVPQLSSGELCWTTDTQELFIGNGSVSNGAPRVGNTRILTEHDSLGFSSSRASTVTLTDSTSPVLIIKLPLLRSWSGDILSDISYSVPYQYVSSEYDFARHGIMKIDANIDLELIKLTDTFTFLNDTLIAHQNDLEFTAVFLTNSGEEYTDPLTQTIGGVGISYTNDYTGDVNGKLTFYAGLDLQETSIHPNSFSRPTLRKNFGKTVETTFPQQTVVDIPVSFDIPFSSTPDIISVTVLDPSAPGILSCSIKSVTPTGMTLTCTNTTAGLSATAILSWYAEGT